MTAGLAFLLFVAYVASIAVGSYLGQNRHNIAAGVLMPLALGWIGTAIVACLPDRKKATEMTVSVEASAITAFEAWLDKREGSNSGS